MKRILIAAIVLLGCPLSALADEYVCMQKDGSTIRQSQPCNSNLKKISERSPIPSGPELRDQPSTHPKADSDMDACDKDVAIKAALEIIHDPESLKHPIDLFKPAWILFINGKKNDAVFWYYAAQVRFRYQLVFEDAKMASMLVLLRTAMDDQINSYAEQNLATFQETIDKVLDWDKKTPNPFRDRKRSDTQNKQIATIYSGLNQLMTTLMANRNEVENKAQIATIKYQEHERATQAQCTKSPGN